VSHHQCYLTIHGLLFGPYIHSARHTMSAITNWIEVTVNSTALLHCYWKTQQSGTFAYLSINSNDPFASCCTMLKLNPVHLVTKCNIPLCNNIGWCHCVMNYLRHQTFYKCISSLRVFDANNSNKEHSESTDLCEDGSRWLPECNGTSLSKDASLVKF